MLRQRVHELLYRDGDARDIDVPDVLGQLVRIHVQHAVEVLPQAARRAEKGAERAVAQRDDALLAVHGLADHAGEEGGGGVGGAPRAHDDAREAQDEGVDEAPAMHVVEENLGQQLVRAVGALGRRGDVVGDARGQRLAVDGLRGRVDDANGFAVTGGIRGAQREEEVPHAVDVDGEREVEVGLGPGRHDAVEDEDGVQSRLRGGGEEGRHERGVGDVAAQTGRVLRVRYARRHHRVHEVG